MKLNLKLSVVLVGMTLVAVGFQNCAKTSFSGASSNVQNSVSATDVNGFVHQQGSCYFVLHQITQPLKVIFIVDVSGSNAGAGGSDPNRSVRSGSIDQFYNDYNSKINFSWNMMAFKDATSIALINNGSTDSPRFGNANDMQGAIVNFQSITDSGYTPYRAAINMATGLISVDTTANAKFVIVFLSDGMPTDYPADDTGNAQLTTDLQNLMGMRPGQISFNTIYYGSDDPVPVQRLKMMADVGGGQFLDTNTNATGKIFAISDVVKVPGSNCSSVP